MDVPALLSGIGSLGIGTLLGGWLSARRNHREARSQVIPAVEEVERTRWFTSTQDSIDPVRAAVLRLEETAVRARLPREPVMLYAALAVASWRVSEKDAGHQLWSEWADLVTDARDLVKSLVWQDRRARRNCRRESELLFRRAGAIRRRSVVSVWAESSDRRAYERAAGLVEPAGAPTG